MSKVPQDKSTIPELVSDLVQSCAKQGARDLVALTEPLSYTDLVDLLKEKGLIVASPSHPPAVGTNTLSSEEEKLLVGHKNEVWFLKTK